MWYIDPVSQEQATGALEEMYHQDLQKDGYVSNTTRSWAYRPEVYDLWMQLLKKIRSTLRLRTYELVTLAAAKSIGCVY